MISVENLGMGFGARVLFSGAGFALRSGERAGLAGPNGAGKSTLMKILGGFIVPDEGRVLAPKDLETGYLPQEGVTHRGRTVWEETESALENVMDLRHQYDQAGQKLSTLDTSSREYLETLDLFGELQLKLEHQDAASLQPRIETILSGLGFSRTDWTRAAEEFSGGWQMRIALARLLLREPGLLLLDEPTNHLDIETVTWLETWLKTYPGTVLVISHDRRFLDTMTTRTLAIQHGSIQSYAGNFTFFERESAALKEQRKRAKENQDRQIAKTQEFIDRFRAKASKATQAQSRIKQLEKIERIQVEEEDSEINFTFPPPPPGGQSVVRLENVTKAYGSERVVIDNWDFEISKGDRIAVVGVNGAGKSTFVKLLASATEPTSGRLVTGHNARASYYSQDHADALSKDRTVLETAGEGITGAAAANLRNLLGCFLFRGDDVFKNVGVLSGGERGRLALCRMLLTPANFLILDEPTNHLDMRSQAVLRHALQSYPGAFVIVSHNRDFLDPLVTKVLEFRPGKKPRLFPGNLTYFLDKTAEERAASREDKGAAPRSASIDGENPRQRRQREAREREERQRTLKPLRKELADCESGIASLEQELKVLTAVMQSGGEEVQAAAARFPAAQGELEGLYSRWAEISDKVEAMSATASE